MRNPIPVLAFTHLLFVAIQSNEVQAQSTNAQMMKYPCTVLKQAIQIKNDPNDVEYHCQLDARDADGRPGMKVRLTDSNGNAYGRGFDCGGGGCQSGRTQLSLPENAIQGDVNDARNWIAIEKSAASNKPDKVKLPANQPVVFESNEDANGRRLAVTPEGDKNVLVVRVSGADSSATLSSAFFSDKIFGTSGDAVNLKSQMEACSYEKTTINPATGPGIVDGVIDVTIAANVVGVDPTDVMNYATAEMWDMGISIQDYDHVMYCLPPRTLGTSWIAFAYLENNISVYNNEWCGRVSVQMHEIAHNYNLDHSGNSVDEYSDRTGYMGISYPQDDLPRMCYNGPKSWQLGWYSDKSTEINIMTMGTWTGTLVGIGDYDKATVDQDVIVKLPRSNSPESLYVHFNRAAPGGINEHTQENQDRVVVGTQQGTGVSIMLSALTVGESYTENDFNGNIGSNFAITVDRINFESEPWTADVTIKYGTDVVGSGTNTADVAGITLQEMWAIKQPRFQFSDLSMEIDFKVNERLSNRQVGFQMRDISCEEDAEVGDYTPQANAALYTFLPAKNAFFIKEAKQAADYTAIGQGTKTYSLGLAVNPRGISDDADLFDNGIAANGAQGTAELKFCVRFSLFAPDETSEVNYLDTQVYVDISLVDGFTIEKVKLEPVNLERNASQAYNVIGYQCKYRSGSGTPSDPTINDPLTPEEEQNSYNQGEMIRVCVRPDEAAQDDGVKMRAIDNFSFTREFASQEAIVDRDAAGNFLTEYDPLECRGSDECWFETLLYASFFSSQGIVTGSGLASMQFGSGTKRLLRNSRRLQDDTEDLGGSEFELTFDVAEGTFSFSDRYSASPSLEMGWAKMLASLCTLTIARLYWH